MVDFPIPGNDDAIRSVALLTRVVADAVADGLMARAGVKSGQEATGEELGAEEPLAEWERELLAGQADKAAVEATAGADPAAPPPASESTDVAAEASQAAEATPEEAGAEASGDDVPEPAGEEAGEPAEAAEAPQNEPDVVTTGGEPVPGDEPDTSDDDITTSGGEPVPADDEPAQS
jgi:small subunit ribosomal protein S2